MCVRYPSVHWARSYQTLTGLALLWWTNSIHQFIELGAIKLLSSITMMKPWGSKNLHMCAVSISSLSYRSQEQSNSGRSSITMMKPWGFKNLLPFTEGSTGPAFVINSRQLWEVGTRGHGALNSPRTLTPVYVAKVSKKARKNSPAWTSTSIDERGVTFDQRHGKGYFSAIAASKGVGRKKDAWLYFLAKKPSTDLRDTLLHARIHTTIKTSRRTSSSV